MLIVHCLIHIQRPEIITRKAGEDWISLHNRPENLKWAEGKVHWLFEHIDVPCLPIVVE